MKLRRYLCIVIIFSTAVLFPLSMPIAHANTLIVNTTADVDTGSCTITCSLRDALSLAVDGDTITFSLPSTPPPVINITLGSLQITKFITIDGGGVVQLEMDYPNQAVLMISGKGASIVGLTIKHGWHGYTWYSTGIMLQGDPSGSQLHLENSVIKGNTIQTGSHVVLRGHYVTFTANNVEFEGSQFEAIDSDATGIATGATISISNSSFTNNNIGISAVFGKITVEDSHFSNNGAGIYATREGTTVAVTNSVFEFNWAGAIITENSLVVKDSTFRNNKRKADSISATGAIQHDGYLYVSGSTFIGNQQEVNTNDSGSGAISNNNSGTPSLIVNSTFRDNYAENGSGAIELRGGQLSLLNSTLAYNRARSSIGSNLQIRATAQLTVANTILVFTYQPSTIPEFPLIGANCEVLSGGALIDGGGNIQYGEIDDEDHDITCVGTVAAPKLAGLANYGGLTLTIALREGSAAIDAGVSSICESAFVGNVDQRGVMRNIGARCDSGAFEGSITTPPDTIGIYRPSTNTFYLRNSNSTGFSDINVSLVSLGMDPITFRDVPVVGDWNGDGIDTVGFYRRGRVSDNAGAGLFVLSDSNSSPQANYSFVLGNPNDTPIVGDWDGDGKDSVGVFRPSNGLIYIKNNLTTGFADYTMVLGNPGDVGIAGDWDNDGRDSPGVYRPGAAPQFYLTNQVCNCVVASDYNVTFGNPGDQPFTGDWNGDGRTGLGIYRTSNGITYLRNDPTTTGFSDFNFVYGVNGDFAFGGVWGAATPPSQMEIAPTFQP